MCSSPNRRYIRLKTKLGYGAFKNVYLAVDTETGAEVAWNQVNLSRLPDGEAKKIRDETELLQKLRHPHIIQFYDVWMGDHDEELVFITEKAAGTLKKYVESMFPVKPKMIRKYVQWLLSFSLHLFICVLCA